VGVVNGTRPGIDLPRGTLSFLVSVQGSEWKKPHFSIVQSERTNLRSSPRPDIAPFRLGCPEPIFYPVLNEDYATQIARDRNAKKSHSLVGYVTRFAVRASYLSQFTVQKVGGALHLEYWIPAERLSEFNQNIVGRIEVLSEFHSK